MLGKTYQVADIAADLPMYREVYSDLFKGLHGFRPRGDMFNTPEMICSFLNIYDEEFEYHAQQEARELVALGEEFGQVFHNWHAYYDFLERKDQREYQEWMAEREQQEDFEREFARRGSPLPYIIAWEHGDRL